MSIFSSIFSRNKSPKKSFVAVIFLLEQTLGISVFEKGVDSLTFVDSRFKNIQIQDYDDAVKIFEDLINPIEQSLDTTLYEVLFVIPSYSVDDTGSKVSQPFKSTISQLVKEFELTALGYVDLFEVVRISSSKEDYWIFLDRGAQVANLILCNNDDVRKKLKVTSDADEICAHIEESATKKAKILYFSSVDHADHLTFERNLVGYVWNEVSTEDIVRDVRLLLTTQLYGHHVAPTAMPPSSVPLDSVVDSHEPAFETQDNVLVEDNSAIGQGHGISTAVPQAVTITGEAASLAIALDAPPVDLAAQDETKTTPSNFDDFVVYDDPNSGASSHSIDSLERHTPQSGDIAQNHNLSAKSGAIGEQHLAKNKMPDNSSLDEDGTKFVRYEGDMAVSSPTQEAVAEVVENENVKGSTKKSLPLSFLHVISSWILPTLFAILLAIGVGIAIFIHKADVVLVVKTTPFEKDIALNNFVMQSLELEKNISANVESSGTKEIGERSKGQVTIASFDDKNASFSAGTRLAVGEKIFRLDEDLSLDPATVNTSAGTKVASKKSGKASATFIGKDGNIEKGSEMIVDGQSKSIYYAIAESAFSGGSKQAVPAVAKEDVDALDQQLEELAKAASAQAETSELNENDLVIKSISKSVLQNVEYSAGIGDAKTELSATAIVKSSIYYGSKLDFLKQVSEVIKVDLGDKYVFDPKNVRFETTKAELSKDARTANLELRVSVGVYIPPSVGNIRKSLVFLPVSQLESKVSAQNNLSNIRLVLTPDFAPFQWFLPFVESNIGIKTISESDSSQ